MRVFNYDYFFTPHLYLFIFMAFKFDKMNKTVFFFVNYSDDENKKMLNHISQILI